MRLAKRVRTVERRDREWRKFAVNGREVAAKNLKLRGERSAAARWAQLTYQSISDTLLPALGK